MTSEDIQQRLFRAMSPEKKLNIAMQLYDSARQLKAAWLRQQHQDWTEQQVQAKVKEIFLYARS